MAGEAMELEERHTAREEGDDDVGLGDRLGVGIDGVGLCHCFLALRGAGVSGHVRKAPSVRVLGGMVDGPPSHRPRRDGTSMDNVILQLRAPAGKRAYASVALATSKTEATRNAPR